MQIRLQIQYYLYYKANTNINHKIKEYMMRALVVANRQKKQQMEEEKVARCLQYHNTFAR